MLGQLGHSRAISAKGAGGRVSAKADRTADHLGDAIASALSSIADRFRGDAGSIHPAKIGTAAAKLGNDALRRLSREVEHRPLATLAVAVGVGILVGLATNRR